MRGSVVEVKVGFFDRFAMDTLRVGQTEQAFFEEWAGTVLVSIDFQNNRLLLKTHSFSFQNAKAMCMRPWVSETPEIPSSPQRKARLRAMSWVKSAQALPSALLILISKGYLAV